MTHQVLIKNIGELLTLAPLHSKGTNIAITNDHLGSLKGAWLAVDDGKVLAYGEGTIEKSYKSFPQIDAQGGLVLPGLVDCHTHPIFGGDRSNEFAKRLDGLSYQDIAAQGGGIRSTIRHSREATDESLKKSCQQRLNTFLSYGVTTVECKSGYGQSPKEELRHLRILNEVKQHCPQELSITYLGLHAAPKEYGSISEFCQDMASILPSIANEGLAQWVDAFVESGYFEAEECETYFQKAKDLGLGIRIHADEFADSQAAAAAARWQAASADHLEEASSNGIQAMAKAGVVAVLLPGTSLYSKIKYADAKAFLSAGCSVALATDFNPGSCLLDNLPQVATLGALYCGLTTAESIAAVTYQGARALRLQQNKGHLSVGADADFVIHPLETKEQWIADFGRHKPRAVYIAGKKAKV